MTLLKTALLPALFLLAACGSSQLNRVDTPFQNVGTQTCSGAAAADQRILVGTTSTPLRCGAQTLSPSSL